jgi:glutathione S-transferase
MLTLYDSPLSPFCRKVRMVLELKGLEFDAITESGADDWGRFNRRAEIPILLHDEFVVLNSADIVGYLDESFPETPVLPRDPRRRAVARFWERTADTLVDAIVTNMAIWTWAEIGPRPEGLLEANRAEIRDVYDDLERALRNRHFICGDLSIADLSLFPHLSAAWHLELRCDPDRHPSVVEWQRRMRQLEICRADLERVRQWWKNRSTSSLETDKVNWGMHRLELYLAQGFHERLIEDIRRHRVLWSVGPHRNSLRAGRPPEMTSAHSGTLPASATRAP